MAPERLTPNESFDPMKLSKPYHMNKNKSIKMPSGCWGKKDWRAKTLRGGTTEEGKKGNRKMERDRQK